MNRIVLWLFSKTSFGKLLDGKKTIIGAVLIIVSAGLQVLEQLAPLFPEAPWLKSAATAIREALEGSLPTLEALGLGFLTVGIIHKSAKAKLPPE